jgi:excinuclease UvrABC nuclease subunit
MAEMIKWLNYDFHVVSMNSNWNDVGGVYIFTGVQGSAWKAFYVGETNSFKNRLVPTHEQWAQAQRLGATHVHAMTVPQETARKAIERMLIETYKPPLNTQHA